MTFDYSRIVLTLHDCGRHRLKQGQLFGQTVEDVGVACRKIFAQGAFEVVKLKLVAAPARNYHE